MKKDFVLEKLLRGECVVLQKYLQSSTPSFELHLITGETLNLLNPTPSRSQKKASNPKP